MILSKARKERQNCNHILFLGKGRDIFIEHPAYIQEKTTYNMISEEYLIIDF